MKLFLARHGESQWQAGETDCLDSTLSRRGHEQARQMALWLQSQMRASDALLYSPMRRATQTAEYIERATGIVGKPLENLREADFHIAEDLAFAQAPCRQQSAAITPRYAQFKRQAVAALDELLVHAKEHHGVVFAVSHSGLIRTLLSVMAGGDMLNFTVPPASVTFIEWREGRWELVWLGKTDYLFALPPRGGPGART